jgi:hypothetical protein
MPHYFGISVRPDRRFEVAAATGPPRSATLRELGLHVDAPPLTLLEAERSDTPWGDDGDAEP